MAGTLTFSLYVRVCDRLMCEFEIVHVLRYECLETVRRVSRILVNVDASGGPPPRFPSAP